MSRETDRRELFEQCIEKCADSMYRVAFRLTGNHTLARELVQETSLAAWKSIEKLRDTNRMRAWMFAILRNQYTKLISKESKSPAPVETFDDLTSPQTNNPNEIQDAVQNAIEQLDEKHRLPLLLVSMEGLSVDEAANVLDIPRGTVLSRLSRSRDKLKAILIRSNVELLKHNE